MNVTLPSKPPVPDVAVNCTRSPKPTTGSVLEVAIFYFLLALEAEKLVGQQISNPVLLVGSTYLLFIKYQVMAPSDVDIRAALLQVMKDNVDDDLNVKKVTLSDGA